MKVFLFRLLKRSIPVVIILSILGYFFALLFSQLVLPQMSEGLQANEDIRVTQLPLPKPGGHDDIFWKAPLMMSLYGVGVLFVSELSVALVRKQKKASLEGRLVHSVTPPKPIPAPDHLVGAKQ